MPYVILEDKKGFKKTHSWIPTPLPRVSIATCREPSFSYNPSDAQFYKDSGMQIDTMHFYADKELTHDVWLYKER